MGVLSVGSTWTTLYFKGQGHYPPFPGLFVCLIKRAGVLPASLFESSGGAVFNWLWGPVLISGFFVDSVS